MTWEWHEATVDPSEAHFLLRTGDPRIFGDEWMPAARVGAPTGSDGRTFHVEFLPAPEESQPWVVHSLDFLLVGPEKPDPAGVCEVPLRDSIHRLLRRPVVIPW